MSQKLSPAAPPARRRRAPLALTLLAALLLALCAALLLALETAPRAGGTAPDATAARNALAAGETLRAFVESGAAEGRLALRAAEINALMASFARLAPGAAGAARLAPDGIELTLSLGPPYLPGGLWANLALGIAAPADGLRIEAARLGRLPLPLALVEAALVRGLDHALGEAGLGRAALDGVARVAVEGDAVAVDFGFDAEGRAALLARLRGRLSMSGEDAELEPIRRQLYWLHRGEAEAILPRDGSALPYLRQILDRATRMAPRLPTSSDHDLAAGGLLALTLYCGEPALAPAIGVGLTEVMKGEGNRCAATTLAGRVDLRRHFVVSAGLYAASTAQAALGIGELKELIDSGEGGSGFSFDDMAANIAGARFAQAFLEAPRAEWPAMAALITSEADILPETRDLPSGMSEAAFAARFGAVDSPAYRATIEEIEARVDALPFHRALAGG